VRALGTKVRTKEGSLQIDDPVVVAHTSDNARQVVAQRADLKAGEFNGPAQIRSYRNDKESYGNVQRLQSILKWTTGWTLVPRSRAMES
jgi:hypothetical protein